MRIVPRPAPEIVRRSFVDGDGMSAETEDLAASQLSLNLRSWSSYCFFLPGAERHVVEATIRAGVKQSTVQVVPCEHPAGMWVRGPRYQLEAALAEMAAS